MAKEQSKSEQFRCKECGQTFNSEREHREHNEKYHNAGHNATEQPSGGRSTPPLR